MIKSRPKATFLYNIKAYAFVWPNLIKALQKLDQTCFDPAHKHRTSTRKESKGTPALLKNLPHGNTAVTWHCTASCNLSPSQFSSHHRNLHANCHAHAYGHNPYHATMAMLPWVSHTIFWRVARICKPTSTRLVRQQKLKILRQP